MTFVSSAMKIATGALAAASLAGCVPAYQYTALDAKYQQMQQTYAAELAADQVQITELEGKLKVTIRDSLLFSEGGFELNRKAKETLDKLAPSLQGLQQTNVVVDGYTDSVPVGRELKRYGIDNNIDLSSKRADNVVVYLRGRGVNPNILSAQGFGATNPVASNDTAEGRAKNRRTEVTLVGPGN